MTRTLERTEAPKNPYMELARLEDVNQEELMKRYMEEIKDNVAEKTDDEVRREEEKLEALQMMEILGLEGIELDGEDPLGQLTEMCAANYKDTILSSQDDPEYKKLVKELNEKEGVYEMDLTKSWVDEDDPLLEKQFAREREKITATLTARGQRKKLDSTATMKDWDHAFEVEEDIFNSFSKKTETSSGYRSSSIFDESRSTSSSSSSNGFRSTKAKTETTGYKKQESMDADYELRQEKRGKYQEMVSAKMLDVVYTGKEKKKVPRKNRMYGGKEKFSLKGLWNKTKEWFHSDEAVLGAKIGAMLCLQTAMAVTSKRLEFDGALQALTFVGMSLGVFFVGREVRSEGFDARRFAF